MHMDGELRIKNGDGKGGSRHPSEHSVHHAASCIVVYAALYEYTYIHLNSMAVAFHMERVRRITTTTILERAYNIISKR